MVAETWDPKLTERLISIGWGRHQGPWMNWGLSRTMSFLGKVFIRPAPFIHRPVAPWVAFSPPCTNTPLPLLTQTTPGLDSQ